MTTRQLLLTHPRYLAYGFLHFFFSAVGQTFFISLFVASISARMGWAEGTFATVYSVLTLTAAFLLPVVGAYVDRLRVRYISTATILTLALGCSLVAVGPNTVVLVLGLFLCRLGGQGVLTLIGSTTIGRYFQEGRGKALSATILGIPAAEVVLPIGAVWVLEAYGYGAVWMIAAATLLFVFLPSVWLLINRFDNFQKATTVAEEQAALAGEGATEQRSWTRGEMLRDTRFHLLLPVIVFSPFMFTGIVFNQNLIAEQRGYTLAWMAFGISTYGAARILCISLAGTISDNLGPRRVLRFIYLATFLGLLCLWSIQDRISVPLFFALSAITAGTESVLWPALYAEWYGPRYLGSIKSLLKVVVVLASAAAPVVISFGIQWSLQGTLLALVIYSGVCLALTQVRSSE